MTPDISKELTSQQIDATTGQLAPNNTAPLEGAETGAHGVTFDDPLEAAPSAVTSAESYRTVAWDFLRLLNYLLKHGGATQLPFRPWAYNTAQALECVLKAYIGHVDRSKLGKPLQTHNLTGLWDMAVQASERATSKLSIASPPPKWCHMLNAFHDRPYLSRYPDGRAFAVELLGWTQIVKDLGAMLVEVDKAFHT